MTTSTSLGGVGRHPSPSSPTGVQGLLSSALTKNMPDKSDPGAARRKRKPGSDLIMVAERSIESVEE